MAMAIEYNMNNSKKLLASSSWQFYEYMRGLSVFGQMISGSERERLKLYKHLLNNRYYAIDQSGLSYGFIHEPSGVSNQSNQHIKFPYYGASSVYTYDCVVKMGATSEQDSLPVDLNVLRMNYLPLLNGPVTDHQIQRYYFPDENLQSDYYHYRRYKYANLPVIYRTDERSFFMPFEELIRETLEMSSDELFVSPAFEKDYIYFEAIQSWRQSGDNFGYDKRSWIGRITYDTFEIVSISEKENDLDKYLLIRNEVKSIISKASSKSLKQELSVLINMEKSGDLLGNLIIQELQGRITKGTDKEDHSIPRRLY